MSGRTFPESLPEAQYDLDDQVRKVDIDGRISFRGQSFRVGRAFQGKHVALRPTTADGVWDVFFSLQPVRNIDSLVKTRSEEVPAV